MKASSENWSNSIKALFLLAAILTAFSSGAGEVNSIVAKVGDASITSVELERYVNPTLKSYMKMMPNDEQIREEYNLERVDALKGLIDSKLLVREANKLEFSIPPMEIDKQLSKERERFTSEEEFQAYLKENKITLQEFKEHLSDSIKAQAVLQEKVFKRVRVLPHEVHKFYVDNKNLLYSSQPSVHLYQILIKDNSSEDGRDPYARISDIKNLIAEYCAVHEPFGNVYLFFPKRGSVLTNSEYLNTNEETPFVTTLNISEDYNSKLFEGPVYSKFQSSSRPYRQ